MKNQLRTISALAVVALVSLVMPRTAFAVKGPIIITQAKAIAGGVTRGDAPGFPVTIAQPGSYVLAGNLTVPDADTDAIVIDSDHVTIDLDGFAILGPTDCSGGLNPCAGAGNGHGISTNVTTPRFNITIRNGTIQGMGARGIRLYGDSNLVEYVHARSNGILGIGIAMSADYGASIVQHNTVQRNGFYGISVDMGRVTNNVVDENGNGIQMLRGSVSQNDVARNAARGLSLSIAVSYIGNTLAQNGTDVTGGKNLGQNLCGDNVCPGFVGF